MVAMVTIAPVAIAASNKDNNSYVGVSSGGGGSSGCGDEDIGGYSNGGGHR
jgi:hypothetical protein